ncbi:RibD family protein [Prochlorococcus sp. MIT 1307]|uniref:RibD family protein n=1 Tax=Prochlorococcus sp. MIT 1307 TaxID=3096219 RepID=UPI002A7578D4|nr:RibD family protein [Prochlorococcus sp. MIT 1307]
MKTPWVRLVLAISLDGRIALPHGGKAHLGGKGDIRVLEEALAWSDGTLIGGGTLRCHCQTCLIHNDDLLKKRQSEGRSPQPVAVVVSSQKKFCYSWPFFQQPIERWLVNTSHLPQQSAESGRYEREFLLQPNWSETLAELAYAGLSRLVLLGGAQLVGSLLQADAVDELQLTMTPKIIGGNFNWVPNDLNNLPLRLAADNAWYLKGNKSLEGNELLVQYIRNRSSH